MFGHFTTLCMKGLKKPSINKTETSWKIKRWKNSISASNSFSNTRISLDWTPKESVGKLKRGPAHER